MEIRWNMVHDKKQRWPNWLWGISEYNELLVIWCGYFHINIWRWEK
jgi:hypothetical protein